MTEGDVVSRTPEGPATVSSLGDDLRTLGVLPSSLLLVHSSLSSLGWVAGGPVAVIRALLSCLGPDGTLVMPAYSGEYTEPSDWEAPAVPESWWPVIRSHMPAFERDVTPSRAVGAVAECFRTWPGAVRSDHPHTSFAAHGPLAGEICGRHPLGDCVGEPSPIARIYERKGHVLLLGVGFGRNSSFHLAEYRAEYPDKRNLTTGSPVLRGGKRVWVEYEELDIWGGDFRRLGADFERDCSDVVRHGPVGAGAAVLFPQRAAVDYAQAWMEKNRTGDWRRKAP